MTRFVAVALCLAPSCMLAQTLGTCNVLPPDNVWNARVDSQPVHPNSANYVNAIGLTSPGHPDFGSGLYQGAPFGIPYITVPGTQPKVPIVFSNPSESDPGPYPIPANAPVEGGNQSGGDRHVLVIDQDNCVLYEMFSSYLQPDGSWTAGSGAVFNLSSDNLRPATWTSADAAGLPIFPGLARYDEVSAGAIKHALRFTAPQTQEAFVWPARHQASNITNTNYPPMGQRFRLKASFTISGYSQQATVIMTALKEYGMILADNGSAWYISGTQDNNWDNNQLNDIKLLVGSDFEAVDESSLTLNPNTGQAAVQNAPKASSAFRDVYGSIRLIAAGSTTTVSAGGVFPNDPAIGKDAAGDTFIAAVDASGALWVNILANGAQSWNGWVSMGGTAQGVPALACSPAGVAYLIVRDHYNQYWLNSYSASNGVGGWILLAGIFDRDPGAAFGNDGSIAIVGRAGGQQVWSGRYAPGVGFGGWALRNPSGPVAAGKPAVVAGSDGAGYVAIRDGANSLWMAQLVKNAWGPWQGGAGTVSSDPALAATGGVIFAAAVDSSNGLWYRPFTEGVGNNWQAWTFTDGRLQTAAAAGLNGSLYVAGKDASDGLWWFQLGGSGWTFSGNGGLAAGAMAAAP